LTSKHARRTVLLRRLLEAVGLVLAGRAGARLATALRMPASRDSLLRLIRALPDPPAAEIEVLGVDDFAVRHQLDTPVDLDRKTRVSPPELLGA
jgi:hypothetical protein